MGSERVSIRVLVFIALIVLLAISSIVNQSAVGETSKTSLEVFNSRPEWKRLPPEFLGALASKLGSVEKTGEFVELCEKTGILNNKLGGIADLAHGDMDFAIGAVAGVLTGYANSMGRQREFAETKRVLNLALILRPRHVPAWISMAVTAMGLGDCQAAVNWADKVLSFKPDPDSKDFFEIGIREAITEEGERRYAEMFAEHEAIGNWKKIEESMKALKDVCRKQG